MNLKVKQSNLIGVDLTVISKKKLGAPDEYQIDTSSIEGPLISFKIRKRQGQIAS